MNVQRRPVTLVAASRVARPAAAPAPAPAKAPASIVAKPPAPVRPQAVKPASSHATLGTVLGGVGGGVAGAAAGWGTLVLLSAQGATPINIAISLGVAAATTVGGALFGRFLGKKI